MNKKQSYLTDYPCKTCIVGAICKLECPKEFAWYKRLSIEDRKKYIESDLYKHSFSNSCTIY